MDENYALCESCYALVLKDYYMDHMEWHMYLNRQIEDASEPIT